MKAAIFLQFFVFIFVLLLLVSSSCSVFHMNPVSVISWSPADSYVEDPSIDAISLTYSASMNRTSAEEAFSFTCDGEEMAGGYTWENNTMRFIPYDFPLHCSEFSMVLTTAAEDENGNNLEQEFSHQFSRTSDGGRPVVLEVSPEDNSFIDNSHPSISVRFSESIDRTSLYNGFSSDPYIDGTFTWKESDTILTFLPNGELTWQEEYTLLLAATVSDTNGSELGDAYSFSFTLGTDSVSPTITSVSNIGEDLFLSADDPEDTVLLLNSNWECFWNLSIAFSEPVQREGLESLITFAPPADFSIPETTESFISTAKCLFTEGLSYNEVYTLTIDTGITDRYGNSMDKPLTFYIRCNGPESLPPEIIGVTFLEDPGSGLIGPYEAYDILDLSNYDPGPAVGFFDIYFRASETAGPDIFSFIDNFSASVTPTGIFSFRLIAVETGTDITPPSTGPPPDPALGIDEYLFRVHIEIDNALHTAGVLTITLDAGYNDSLGNPMLTDWIFPLNEATP